MIMLISKTTDLNKDPPITRVKMYLFLKPHKQAKTAEYPVFVELLSLLSFALSG